MFVTSTTTALKALVFGVGFVALLQSCSGPVRSAQFDVAWFSANPAARAEMLRRCRNDVGLGRHPACGNAERAEGIAFENRMGRASGVGRGSTRPRGDDGMYDSPIVRDALQRACQEPAGRRLAGRQCDRT